MLGFFDYFRSAEMSAANFSKYINEMLKLHFSTPDRKNDMLKLHFSTPDRKNAKIAFQHSGINAKILSLRSAEMSGANFSG
jgi:hypothetical protein